jgi:hypothetical protein
MPAILASPGDGALTGIILAFSSIGSPLLRQIPGAV